MAVKPEIVVRRATAADASDIALLFFETVRQVNIRDYSREQVEAWAPCVKPAANWAERQVTHKTYVAVIGDQIAGFAELEESGHIDCFYCHRDHQRCGAGAALFRAVEEEARRQSNQKLFAEVSVTAVPFFERQGFRIVREQEVVVHEVAMTNFVMQRDLEG